MFFGSSPFASQFAHGTAPLSISVDEIAFDGYGLQNAGIIVSDANFEDAGENELNTYPLPRRDGTGFLSRFWRKKRISLKGIVK